MLWKDKGKGKMKQKNKDWRKKFAKFINKEIIKEFRKNGNLIEGVSIAEDGILPGLCIDIFEFRWMMNKIENWIERNFLKKWQKSGKQN